MTDEQRQMISILNDIAMDFAVDFDENSFEYIGKSQEHFVEFNGYAEGDVWKQFVAWLVNVTIKTINDTNFAEMMLNLYKTNETEVNV